MSQALKANWVQPAEKGIEKAKELVKSIILLTTTHDTDYDGEGYWGHDTFMPRDEIEIPALKLLEIYDDEARLALIAEIENGIDDLKVNATSYFKEPINPNFLMGYYTGLRHSRKLLEAKKIGGSKSPE